LTAFLVVFQWVGAKTIDWFPRALHSDMRSVHIVAGSILALLIVTRLIWRWTGARVLPAANRMPLQLVTWATHAALYGLVIAIVTLGILLACARGDTIFGLFSLAPIAGFDAAYKHSIHGYHELLANLVLILAGFHAAAALFHRYVLGDAVLARIGLKL
jgi:cytochrome b561